MTLPTTTRAAVLVAQGKPLELMTLTLPSLKPGQALVEIAWSGVCHTQLNEVRGKRGPDRFLPHTLGHEAAGQVLAVADGVAKVKPGDRVVLSWIKGSGAEVGGTVYAGPDGNVNSGAISTFMTHTITCENRLTPIPAAMPLREAALLGCAVPTGGGVIRNTARVKRGMSVAVFGAGGIGSSAILVGALVGADPLIAVDVVPDKLKQARRLGATHVIDSRAGDPVEQIRALTKGNGVDVSVEAVGRPEVMEAAFAAVRNGGGLCVLAGNVAAGERIRIDPFDLIQGKNIRGTWGGETNPDADIPYYAEAFAKGLLRLNDLSTQDYALSAINQALDDLEAGHIGRALVRMAI